MALLIVVCLFVVVLVLLGIVISLLPLVALIGGVVLLVRALTGSRAPAAAAPPMPVVPAPLTRDDHERHVAWAVGLIVTGILWTFSRLSPAAILVGLGAGLLTRGLMTSRRPPAFD